MLNLKKYLQARIKFVKSDIDYTNKENVIRNMYACYELADVAYMADLADLYDEFLEMYYRLYFKAADMKQKGE